MNTPRIRLGQLLVDAKILTAEQLDRVLAMQKTDGRRLGTLLVESGSVTETQVTQILSQQLSVPWVSLYHIDFSRQLLNLVPREVAEKYCLVPIYVRHVRKQGDTLYVAMDDPTNEAALEECRQWSGLPARAMIAAPSDIRNAIRVYYGGGRASVAPGAQADARGPASQPAPAQAFTSPSRPSPAPTPSSRPVGPVADTPPIAKAPVIAKAPSEPPVSIHEADFVASPPPAAASPVDPPPAAVSPVDARPAAVFIATSPPDPSEAVTAPPPPSSSIASEPLAAAGPASTPAPASKPPPPSPKRVADDGPEVEVREVEIARRAKGKGPRMIALTFLDGTTIALPAARKRDGKGATTETVAPAASARDSSPPASERAPDSSEDQLTARDLVAALRAVAHGADATEILGDNVKWEKMFAALLSVLLRKHLIADWEFVEELKKL